jgi:hypothetical protein
MTLRGSGLNVCHLRTVGASWKVLFFLLAFVVTQSALGQTVYVTRTGEKYHKDSCRYLSESKIATTLAEAKSKAYTACSVCKPPLTLTNELSDSDESPSDIPRAVSTQCTGMTKSGKRCSRMTKASNGRCYQH